MKLRESEKEGCTRGVVCMKVAARIREPSRDLAGYLEEKECAFECALNGQKNHRICFRNDTISIASQL